MDPASASSGLASSSSSSYGGFTGKGKSPAASSAAPEPSSFGGRERRVSLLGSSLSKTEHIVVNVGSPEQVRLITCVKSSQGFEWSSDIFLPSYANDRDSRDLERRQDPVEDIIVTDEEIAEMFPQ
ncbi:hypothetical protein BU16DRAFT_527163 [Lophium mytilinum]|uniref:Uncharacterized protein n=1 Tax=Lophium mytilinum TaxID=390894 RepID=A0A6A6QU87_9PEZI|nr:hypothetical protein BU16DRAFT_527163 [Lophium mytilinum]